MPRRKVAATKMSSNTRTVLQKAAAGKIVKDSPPLKPEPKNMKREPSAMTLHLMDCEGMVIWQRPLSTLYYAVLELVHLGTEFLRLMARSKLLLFLLSILSAVSYYIYLLPGDHQPYVQFAEKKLLWWLWWVGLGILSSIGLGSGLHTFILYLGPHIAAVTLAAYECESLNFPEPPYPESIVCPDQRASSAVNLWAIVSKVRVEALLWGIGTALGELPPYFMARAARLGGQEPDDEDYKAWKRALRGKAKKQITFTDRVKLWIEATVTQVGFPGILLFASIPNPLFDLAGITCGHFLVPFWSFFTATLIGKSIIKMHVQMLFVIVAFSEHYADRLLQVVAQIPRIGHKLREPFKEFLTQQRQALHGNKDHQSPKAGWVQNGLQLIVTGAILLFSLSIINCLAQRYYHRAHKPV